ncbi:Uncharacterised protein [[Actinobacillus] rossii]|uniref:ATPase dynein-related AAA domain-containing protein n=1 Tax=[Actinobacillus] rossii TaxID=123820 RepID=A0A380TPA8_9PAST|nr:Uncharacterised protein [[Actinobacillus] rossii]
MTTLIKDYLNYLDNIEKGHCWYLVKQDCSFWKQCYFVSILEEYKKQNNNLNFSDFFDAEILKINEEKGLNLPKNYRALRISYFYGLLDDPERKYNKYINVKITDVYFEILKRTNREFEKTELYKDIIQAQVEKMFVSSEIDEENDSVRKDFRLYPIIFLYKILLELGRATGKFEITFDEYKYFVITQPIYENFLDCLLLITESRLNANILNETKKFSAKLDSRFNLVLNELDTLEIKDEKILLKYDSINRISKLVYSYENKELLKNSQNPINFLASTESFDSILSLTPDITQNLSLPKPFLLLAGVSGTGKSRFVREQAKQTGEYQLVAVRPDWHEPSDLLGYVSRLNGTPQYVMTDILKFIIKAWQAVENAGLIANGKVRGTQADLANVAPYWLCLDEMNLAPVEQYFADYLSVIETREWTWADGEFEYRTDALLSSTSWDDIVDFKNTLGVSDRLWNFFVRNGIGIPFNLIVAGTVNMDETTHAFSRKVLDRALSFDFNKFYPNDFNAFFEPKTTPKLLSYPTASKAENLGEITEKSIAFLTALNAQLADSPFELAYRALNELLLSVQSLHPQDDVELQAVWDDFVMTKVLPRIEGDEVKIGKLLDKITDFLEKQLNAIWEDNRPDLWRESIDGSMLEIDCRSKPKLARMRQQLEDRGMVSFW